MNSENVISMDGQWATVLLESGESLLQDVYSHKELMLHEKSESLPQENCPIDMSPVQHRSINARSLSPSMPSMVTYDLPLTKSDVSFLIGKHGERIKSIREASGTIIKIIPISEKLTQSELNHPDSIAQTITVTGSLYTTTIAIATIEAHLKLHHI